MRYTSSNTSWPARLDIHRDENINIIDGYLSAARILVETVRAQDILADELAYPIMYLYRHYLELTLKGIWRCLWQLNHLDRNFPKHHRLLDLWAGYREILVRGAYISEEVQEEVYMCLTGINDVDPHAESFRFTQRKDGKRIGDILPSLDISLVAVQIESCVENLEVLLLFLLYEVERKAS